MSKKKSKIKSKTLSQYSFLAHALLLIFTLEFSRHDSGHAITKHWDKLRGW